MGVLGNQPPRQNFVVSNEYLDEFLADAGKLAKKHKISVESVIEAKRVLELERGNEIRIAGGDYHDEHMGGLGALLERIAASLEARESEPR